MKKLWLLTLAALNILICRGQPDIIEPEVGVVEHLNDTIPLHLKFVNDNSDTITLGEIVDKPTIFSFVYFDCPGLCSPLLEGVGDVIRRTDLILGKDYQVVTISFNFRDTPEKARDKKQIFTDRYAKDYKEGWHFLTADSTTIFEVTHAFGYKVKAVGFDFVHPSAIIAVSPHGKITRYLYGLSFLPLDFKMALIEAQKEEARPAGQKVLLYCFAYDPAGKRYVLDVLKISGTVLVFILILFVIWLWRNSRRKKTINT